MKLTFIDFIFLFFMVFMAYGFITFGRKMIDASNTNSKK